MDMTWQKWGTLALILCLIGTLIGWIAVSAKNTELEASYNDKLEEIADLTAEKNNISEQLGAMEDQSAEVDRLNQRVSELNGDVADLNQQLDDKEDELKEAHDQVATLSKGETGDVEVFDELLLGEELDLGTIDNSDLSKLVDVKIEYDEDKYDIHEEVSFGSGLVVETNLLDEDFKGNTYLLFNELEALTYSLIFDDPIELNGEDNLEVGFAGRTIEISEIDDDCIVLRQGTEYVVEEGESITVGDKVINVKMVGDGFVFLISGSDSEKINEDETDEVNGVDVEVVFALENDDMAGIAKLYVGDDVTRELCAGDEWIEDNDEYLFGLETDGDELEGLSIIYNEYRQELEEDFPPFAVGEVFRFLDLFTVEYEGLQELSWNDYKFTTVLVNGLYRLKIVSSDDEGIHVENDETDKIYFDGYVVHYDDEEYDIEDTVLVFGDSELELSYDEESDVLTIGDLTAVFDHESGDLQLSDYASKDYDVFTYDGLKIRSPEDNNDRDKIELSVPDEAPEATILVR
jgi:hypothetical protein